MTKLNHNFPKYEMSSDGASWLVNFTIELVDIL